MRVRRVQQTTKKDTQPTLDNDVIAVLEVDAELGVGDAVALEHVVVRVAVPGKVEDTLGRVVESLGPTVRVEAR